jgi:hypothetical protein
VSDTGQNLRHNVIAGGTTVKDAPLTIAAGTSVVTATGVTAAAYTNNDLVAATGTTLFDIDTAGNRVVVQSPPNGVPTGNAVNLVPSGNLGVDPDVWGGFDVYTRLERDAPVDNLGFASLMVLGVPGFYRINLLTGQAILIGQLAESLIDVALPLDQ